MITPTELTKQLKTYLPIFTDLFTETLTVSSASVDASNILTINSTAHGKSAGGKVVITGGTFRNPISAVVLEDGEIRFTTQYEHDFIMPSLPLDLDEITLGGFTDAGWNATHDIAGVPNRESLIFNGSLPTLNGNEYVVEDRSMGAQGIQTIDTSATNSFTLDLSAAPPLPVGAVYNLNVISGFRIYAAADFNRAQQIYTKQDTEKACVFVIMTDGDVGKDAHTMNDSMAGFTSQDLHLMRIQRNFSTVVFLPTHDDLSGVNAQDLCYGDIYTSLLYTLFGYEGDGAVITYSAVPVSDGPTSYNSAYYAHVYDWQLPVAITFEDGFLQPQDVAFRDIANTYELFSDEEAVMTSNIDLDEEPV